MADANQSRSTRSVSGTAYTPSIAASAFSVTQCGEGFWSWRSVCDPSEWCAGSAAEVACETLSEWPPKAAASASQHGNNAVLTQNTTQASTNAARATRHRRSGRLLPGTTIRVRVDENAIAKLHPCQEPLTAMHVMTFTREALTALYASEHKDPCECLAIRALCTSVSISGGRRQALI